jgi:uncharacterized protein (TIGR00159 family)
LFELGLVDVLDVAFVALLLYGALLALRTARAGLVLAGMAILLATYVAARQLGMQLTAWLFQGFFAIFVVIVVVVFQSELRQIFERIAVLGLRRGRVSRTSDPAADALVRAVVDLARNRIGALLVIEGHDPIERHVEGGIELEGHLSEPLVLSIFDPHSPGHDGAAVVRGDRIERFAVHLPLSSDFGQLGRRGTRHSAALGLAERTDAMCIVVSEERGTVSVAEGGRLRELPRAEALEPALRAFLDQLSPRQRRRDVALRMVRERWREKAIAAVLASGLWVAFVPGAQQVERRFVMGVSVENLPAGFALEKVEPDAVEIVLEGPRRAFFLLDESRLAVRLDAPLVELGRRSFELGESSVQHPENVAVKSIEPRRVRLSVKRTNGGSGEGGAPADAGSGPVSRNP